MASQYKGIPEGASTVIPRLICRDVEAQIEFCRQALGAVEHLRRPWAKRTSSTCDAEIRTRNAYARS